MKHKLKELCFEVTNLCSLKCLHCSTKSVLNEQNNFSEISLDIAKSTIDHFVQLGGEILEISGGEPLLYPHLRDLCAYANNHQLDIKLYTSGVIKSNNNLSSLTTEVVNDLMKLGVDKFIFNMQGSNEAIHDKITRTPGSFFQLKQSIKNVKDAGQYVGIHFVPMKINYKDLPNLANLCFSLGVDELAILRFVPQGRGQDNENQLKIGFQNFRELLETIIKTKEEFSDLNLRVGCPLDFLALYDSRFKAHGCKAGKCTCSISPEGNVLPCPGFKNAADFIAGNINDNTLIEIWKDAFKTLRNFDIAKLSEPCKSCKYLYKCFGRCVAQRYITYGDIYKGPDPDCPKIDLLQSKFS